MTDRLTSTDIERALERLGAVADVATECELLVVGGAAGMLTGVLPAARTTTDCDVMVYLPPSAMGTIERAAGRVAEELGLAANWLNSDVQLRLDTLPDGWRDRRVWIGQFGRLRVFAASRIDLAAMKVVAGRTQDLEDLAAMKLQPEDGTFIRAYLRALEAKGTPVEQIEEALALLDALGVDDQ